VARKAKEFGSRAYGNESGQAGALDPDAKEAISIDALLERLEHVVEELEGGDLPLEHALARFEEGVRLARQGSTLLDAVERRVDVLLADRDETVPLDRAEDITPVSGSGKPDDDDF